MCFEGSHTSEDTSTLQATIIFHFMVGVMVPEIINITEDLVANFTNEVVGIWVVFIVLTVHKMSIGVTKFFSFLFDI